MPHRFTYSFFAAIASATLFAGCSRFLPPRHGTATSFTIIIDTRRNPVVQLTGCFIPETFPAYTRLPVDFLQKIPADAKFISATQEVVLKNGDPLALLETVIENNKVYLECAVPKETAFTQEQVQVTAQYEYRY